MLNDQFKRRREKFTRKRFDMCDRKAIEYANDADRLRNFKRGAERLPLKCPCCGEIFHPSPLYILMVYKMKHFDALCHYAGVGYLENDLSEPIEGRVADDSNYDDLFLNLDRDLKEKKCE